MYLYINRIFTDTHTLTQTKGSLMFWVVNWTCEVYMLKYVCENSMNSTTSLFKGWSLVKYLSPSHLNQWLETLCVFSCASNSPEYLSSTLSDLQTSLFLLWIFALAVNFPTDSLLTQETGSKKLPRLFIQQKKLKYTSVPFRSLCSTVKKQKTKKLFCLGMWSRSTLLFWVTFCLMAELPVLLSTVSKNGTNWTVVLV